VSPAKFKTYVCLKYPFLNIGTLIKNEHGVHRSLHFGHGGNPPGYFTATCKEDEQIIEKNSHFKLDVFEVTKPGGEPEAGADDEAEGSEEAPSKARRTRGRKA
jgi:hypothetical protein